MVLTWFEPNIRLILPEILLLFGIALAISSIGFYRVVYFTSIGYACSIAAMAVITPVRQLDSLTWASALQNIFLVLWGLRLGIYLQHHSEWYPELGKYCVITTRPSFVSKSPS